MLESTLRVTGTQSNDWTITKEPTHERFATGMKEMQEGKRAGFAKLMARVFYADGCGDFEHHKGTLNGVLGLPEESIDDATEVAIARSKVSG